MNLLNNNPTIVNLKNDHFHLTLSHLCHKYLQSLYANYLYFSFENSATQQRLVFNTNPTWYQYYVEAKLIDHCPLYAATMHFSNQSKQGTSHFLWNQIIPEGRKQREVTSLRAEHDIANGISFSKRTMGYQIILGLAAELNNDELEAKYMEALPIIITLFTEASYVCFRQFSHI